MKVLLFWQMLTQVMPSRIVAYPLLTKDAQTIGVNLDSGGNVYGSGYACNVIVDCL